jgi:hypothetical protein
MRLSTHIVKCGLTKGGRKFVDASQVTRECVAALKSSRNYNAVRRLTDLDGGKDRKGERRMKGLFKVLGILAVLLISAGTSLYAYPRLGKYNELRVREDGSDGLYYYNVISRYDLTNFHIEIVDRVTSMGWRPFVDQTQHSAPFTPSASQRGEMLKYNRNVAVIFFEFGTMRVATLHVSYYDKNTDLLEDWTYTFYK